MHKIVRTSQGLDPSGEINVAEGLQSKTQALANGSVKKKKVKMFKGFLL